MLSNGAIIITFTLCGAWHGNTVAFLIWGVYHGLGLSAVNIYQKWKRKVRNEAVRRYFGSRLSYAAGVFLTFNFYSVGLLLFVLSLDELHMLLSRLT